MKFFYATILFLLTSYILFWGYISVVPAPKLQLSETFLANPSVKEDGQAEELARSLRVIKGDSKNELYVFDPRLADKRSDAIFLYSLMGFGSAFVAILLFHRKSYIIFPFLAAIVFATVGCCMVWQLTNALPLGLYLDLQDILTTYSGYNLLKFLGSFLFIELFFLVFGLWYKLPD